VESAPPVLAKFITERRRWRMLGIPARPLDERPWWEADDYDLIMGLWERRENQG